MKKSTLKPRRKKTVLIPKLSITTSEPTPASTIGDLIDSAIQDSTLVTSEINVVFPTDWWQAVKDRFFPSWAKTKWPVRYERHTYYSHSVKDKPQPQARVPGTIHVVVV